MHTAACTRHLDHLGPHCDHPRPAHLKLCLPRVPGILVYAVLEGSWILRKLTTKKRGRKERIWQVSFADVEAVGVALKGTAGSSNTLHLIYYICQFRKLRGTNSRPTRVIARKACTEGRFGVNQPSAWHASQA